MIMAKERGGNRTVVLQKKGDLQLVDKEIPEPGPGQVQIGINVVGLCGSDIHYWTYGRNGDKVLEKPIIPGHEASGIITKLGEGVQNFKIGDRVALEPGVPCRRCELCSRGRYNLCPDIVFLSSPPVDGCLRQYHVHHADFCHKLPDHLTFEQGAMLEPLSVAVHACQRAGLTLGQKVLICGAGPIGILCALTAKAMGAKEVCITVASLPQSAWMTRGRKEHNMPGVWIDYDEADCLLAIADYGLYMLETRLKFAKMFHINHTLHVENQPPEQLAAKVEELMSGKPDVTIECSGAESSIQTAIYATKSGGVVVLVGVPSADVTLPIVQAATREVDIRGVYRYANAFPTALAIMSSRQVSLGPLVTHRFNLDHYEGAFEEVRSGRWGSMKVVIRC